MRRLSIISMVSTNDTVTFLVNSIDDGLAPLTLEITLTYFNRKLSCVNTRFVPALESIGLLKSIKPVGPIVIQFKDTILKAIKLLIKEFQVIDL